MSRTTRGSHTARQAGRLVRIAFVMEQHLGHRTYAENLREALTGREDVETVWVPVSYKNTGGWVEHVPFESAREALRGRAEVRNGVRSMRPDVCVYNTQVPAALGGRIGTRQPFVLCTDVTPLQYDAMSQGYHHGTDQVGAPAWFKHRWNRHILKCASAHAPWSGWVARSLVQDYGIDLERIEVIPPGVDMKRWSPGARELDRPLRLLFVGGDFERKGGRLLLESLSLLQPGMAELDIVTRDAVPRQPSVTVHHDLSANDPALVDLYRRSDVFVLPSRWETFGIAAVEAAACGLAILATPVGGLEELVIDGQTGFHLAVNDAHDLARRIRQFADNRDLSDRMGAAARSRAVAEFDSSVNADRLVKLALGSGTSR